MQFFYFSKKKNLKLKKKRILFMINIFLKSIKLILENLMMQEKLLNKVRCILIFLYLNLNSDMEKKTGIFSYFILLFKKISNY